jgi:DNA-binding XRE family transcriptional regulator
MTKRKLVKIAPPFAKKRGRPRKPVAPPAKPKGGRPSYVPTEETRNLVKALALAEYDQDVIAKLIGIDAKTLRKHFRGELDDSMALANAHVLGNFFNLASSKDFRAIPAAKFWLERNLGWKPPASDVNLGVYDLTKLSDEQLTQLYALAAAAAAAPGDAPAIDVPAGIRAPSGGKTKRRG